MLGFARFMKDLVTKKRTVIVGPTDNFCPSSPITTRSLVEMKIQKSLQSHAPLEATVLHKPYVTKELALI